jgi:hypothetical protein
MWNDLDASREAYRRVEERRTEDSSLSTEGRSQISL